DYLGQQVECDATMGTLRPSSSATGARIADRDSPLSLHIHGDDFQAIYHLLCRPWFERLWVRQEILLANSNALVMCGSREILWERLRNGWACVALKSRGFEHPQEFDINVGGQFKKLS